MDIRYIYWNTLYIIEQVQVQNKLQLALPLLPQAVQQQGLRVTKSTKNFLMIIGLISEDGSMTRYDLMDYTAVNIVDPVSRVQGVGEVMSFGTQYALRIWLDADKLRGYNLTPTDVKQIIQAYNVQVSAGQLGGAPYAPGQQLNATVTAQTQLQTPEEFGNIPLRGGTDASKVRLRDVARIELGTENYEIRGEYNGKPAAGLAVRLASGANALDTAEAVRAKMADLARYFPPGMKAVYPYDTSPFVKMSIEEVVETLVIAIVLVFLVMFLFLQSLRATFIPTIAVPIVLLGTFGVLSVCGFSINTLTMFAMVLAIGLLVDDAIVVVENVERVMEEEGLSPKEATRKSMGQITNALIGITMVLAAVFLPMAFFGGSTGVIYRQFSITIVSAMVLSVIVALVLTPALCASILKPADKSRVARGGPVGAFFNGFNSLFTRGRRRYIGIVERMLGRQGRYIAFYGVIILAVIYLLHRMPTAYLPDEDQGILLTQVQLPAGATQERTLRVIDQVKNHFLVEQKEAVREIFAVAGFSLSGRGQNGGMVFVRLRDWDERKRPDLRIGAVARKAMMTFARIRDGMVFVFAPPAVIELGTSTGFDMQLQDRGGLGHQKLIEARNQLLGMCMQNPVLMGVRPNGQDDTVEYRLDIDWERAGAMGVSVADIHNTLQTAWSGEYVNDFIDRGRVKRVYLQSDARFRMQPEDFERWYVRNRRGDMVPFSAFATAHWLYGPPRLERYNGFPSVEILGQAVPGKSSGDAMREMEKMVAQLPAGIGMDWTGLSYQERMAGVQAPALYAISILVIFLCMAALYESWSLPLSVMLVVPLGVVGALLASTLMGKSNDVYFQVGILTTIGLAAKNGILIVEFAKAQMERGSALLEATLEGARLRLRPILMTSLAFNFGVLPLAVSAGAGSGAQNAIGICVTGGMLAATFLAIFYIPLFFVMVIRLFRHDAPHTPAPVAAPEVK